MMKAKIRIAGLIGALAMSSTGAQAQVVNWHFEGPATAYYRYTYPWTSAPTLDNSYINADGGTTISTDLTVNLDSDAVTAIKVYSTHGSAAPVLLGALDTTGLAWASSYLFKETSGWSTAWPGSTPSIDANPGVGSEWIYTQGASTVDPGILPSLYVAGTGLPLNSYTLRDLNDALASGHYSGIQQVFGVGCYQPRCLMGYELVNITSVSVSAIPEPASGAMMVLGLAAVGGLQARRRWLQTSIQTPSAARSSV
ncbi:MAG: PEP-CTERM sorting domain-containing protein [Aquabacterium sp.]